MTRLSLRRNPLGLLFSGSLWAAAWYLFSYLFTGSVLFAVVLAAAVLGAGLSFTLIGLVMLVAADVVIRACADAERVRLAVVSTEPVRGLYRDTAGQTWPARLRTRWTDPALWRDIAYLCGLYPLLLALDAAVLCIWLTFLAGITTPVWYAKISTGCVGVCLHGDKGVRFGTVSIDTLSRSLVLAAICLVAFLLFSYVVVATAKLHAAIARSLLRPPADPLRGAREVLGRPGPLTSVGRPQAVVGPDQRSSPQGPG